MNASCRPRLALVLGFVLWCLYAAPPANGQGIFLTGVGPVNRSMGGAAVAAPIDGIGALHWNPATISALPTSELSFGMELLLADSSVSSTIPALGLSGTSRSEPGVTPIPAVAWVHHSESRPELTYGLGVISIAGFSTNYAASATNPIFFPQEFPPGSGMRGGFGRLYSEAQFLQIVPTVSIALTDQLSIGIAPTATLGKIVVDPFVFDAPDDADGDGLATFASGRATRWHWGIGAQLGIYYIGDSGLNLGASIKSPQWFEDFRYKSENELGLPRTLRVKLDLPMIISVGMSYSGIENFLFAVDMRYFDYKNTDGFGPAGFAPDGSLRGLGWSNIFEVATGMQCRLTDRLYGRVGYTYNQNPIRQSEALFNLGSPLVLQHWLSFGGSYLVNDFLSMNLAVVHAFPNRVTGPLVGSPDPMATVSTQASGWALSLGMTARY